MDTFQIETTGVRVDEVASLLLHGGTDRPGTSDPPPRPWSFSISTGALQVLQLAAATWRTITGSRADAHPQPSRQRVRERLALVHRSIVEFHSRPASTGEPMLVQTGILINSLFDRYFFPKFGGAPPADPEPVFDLLLQIVDSDPELPFIIRAASGLEPIALLCMPLSSCVEEKSLYTAFAFVVLQNLADIWTAKKQQRLEAKCVSPMPWSIVSRTLEDQPFIHVQFARMEPTVVYEVACRESGIPRSTADFIRIPPMRWLGASHDGHDADVSVHLYVLARYKMGRSFLEHAALWQSALTFGVLEAITGLTIPEKWFLTTSDDGAAVFTSQLVSALAFTFGLRLYFEHDNIRRRSLADHAYSTIDWAYKALAEELECSSCHPRSLFWSTGISDSEVDDIVCCIYSLLAVFRLTLTSMMQWKSMETGEDPCHGPHISPSAYQSDIIGRLHQSYTRKMLAIGWCPYTLAKLRKTESEAAVILGITNMEKPSARHHSDEHGACTEESCTVHNVDPATYKTQHTTPTCPCSFLTPPFSDVEAMLMVREVPVLTYNGGHLSVRRAADGPYIAISHVWADGLGSTTEMGLPSCQVSRISAFARQLVPDGAFWIDGLCIPEAKSLRKGAIRLMAQTYRGAEKVLVLDKSIRLHCALSHTPAENILRVKTSVWMQRIWTMHEAYLARELYFEFSDGLVAGRTLRQGLEPRRPVRGHLSWWWDVMKSFMNPSILDPVAGERDRRFTQVARSIAFCTTSKPEDATVAVAGMLDVDVSKLIEEPDADARMRVLLLEMKTLSVDIMFSRPLTTYEAERLPYPGFRWAPRNVTAINWSAGMSGGGTATCSSEGLTTEDAFPVVFLTEVFRHRSETGYDGKGVFAVFDVLQDGRFLVMKPTPTGARPFDSFEARDFNALVVRPRDGHGQETMRRDIGLNSGSGSHAILLDVHQSVDVLAVHIPPPHRVPESGSSDRAQVLCEYRFMTELWQPPVQASSAEDLAQSLPPGTSYLCASGRMIQARITLT